MVVKTNKWMSAVFFAIVLAFLSTVLSTKFFLGAVIGVIGIFLMLYDFRIGLFAAAFIYPFLPDMLGLLMFLGLGVFFLFKKFLYGERPLYASIYGFAISIYFIAALINTFTSIDISGSIRDFGLLLSGLSFLFAFVNTVKTQRELNAFILTLLLGALIVGLIGIMQHFTGVEMRPEWLDVENNPDAPSRVYSVFFNPNILAEYLVFMIPIAVGMSWQSLNLKRKSAFILATCALMLCIFMTLSRGGWIGIFAAALTFVLLIDKRLLILALPASLLSITFMPQKILERILSIGNLSDTSNAYRIDIWKVAIEMIKDHPIAGVGFGYVPFKDSFVTYIRTIFIYHAHNTYLEIAAEIGITGFLIFFSMLFIVLRKLVALRKSESGYVRAISAGLAASFVGIFTHGLVEHILYIPRIIFTFWIFMAISISLIRIEGKKDGDLG